MANDMNDLQTRLDSEKAFHDAKYGGDDLYPKHYKANPTFQVYQRMKAVIGDTNGKRLLEYGCGEGWTTCDLAKGGGFIEAFDISDTGVNNTKAALTKAGLLDRCSIRQMAAEHLDYPDESFDLAVGFAILHHLDIPKSLDALYRVLKPGGRAIFAEPLGTNPVINFYRNRTPQFRTPDEAPLILKKFRAQASKFRGFEHHECYFTALAALAMLYVPVINKAFVPVNNVLCKFDDWFLPKAGPLRNLAWYSIIVLEK